MNRARLAAVFALFYWAASATAHLLRHPELYERPLILYTFDALLWR